MQNKANFKKLPMSAKPFAKTTYENFCYFLQRKNKANSKPNKANFKNDKNERKLIIIKELRTKNDLFPQKKQSQFKANPEQSRGMNINSAITKCYENNPLLDAKKTKPIQTQSCPPEADFRKDKINLFSLWGGGLNFMHLRP